MADQCIVCLENLDSAIPLQPVQGDEEDGGGGSGTTSSNSSSGSGSSGPSGSTTTTTTNNQQLLTDLNPLPLAAASPTASSTTDSNGKVQPTHDGEDNIAVIQVCGHILHDTCLKAWTGKANSCPICRQAFHLVEVYDKIGGTFSLSS